MEYQYIDTDSFILSSEQKRKLDLLRDPNTSPELRQAIKYSLNTRYGSLIQPITKENFITLHNKKDLKKTLK